MQPCLGSGGNRNRTAADRPPPGSRSEYRPRALSRSPGGAHERHAPLGGIPGRGIAGSVGGPPASSRRRQWARDHRRRTRRGKDGPGRHARACDPRGRRPDGPIRSGRRHRGGSRSAADTMTVPLKTKILLADDHTVVRGGLRLVLDAQPDLEVVAEASDGAEAVERALEEDIDLSILDVTMPRMTGLQAAAELSRRRPGLRTLILSMHANEQYV